jgi:membrane protein implicated in regulation of membrane protease activity
MNAAAPPKEEKKTTTTATATLAPTGFGAILGGLAVLPIVFLIVFHAGAAYLSYQKYQSGMWAFVNFLFAYFYYPYYAFFLAGTPANVEPSPINTMMGGMMKVFGARRRR